MPHAAFARCSLRSRKRRLTRTRSRRWSAIDTSGQRTEGQGIASQVHARSLARFQAGAAVERAFRGGTVLRARVLLQGEGGLVLRYGDGAYEALPAGAVAQLLAAQHLSLVAAYAGPEGTPERQFSGMCSIRNP